MAVSPDSATINSMIYSYKALSTGAQVVGQQTLWTEQRIQSTLDSGYISNRLKAGERPRLSQTLAFGDGLTDDTYLDFILERASKLFLALCEVGRQERIFRAIDLSYDDGDLPLPQEAVTDLGLAVKRDDKINRQFETIQHRFVLREIEECGHLSYKPEETVPLEYIHKAAATQSLQQWIRVRVPARPGELLARRRLVTSPPDALDSYPAEFFEDLEAANLIEHDHIVPVWASYTHKGAGYVITPFVAEYTLKSYLEVKYTPQFGQLSKLERPRLLLKWMHCLSDALGHLHSNGFPHSAIMPSNIVIDSTNNIAFSDIACLNSFQQDKPIDPTEFYDYDVPESHQADRSPHIVATPAKSTKSSIGSRLFRRKRSHTSGLSDDSSHERLHNEVLVGNHSSGSGSTALFQPMRNEKQLHVTSAGHGSNVRQSASDVHSVTSSDASSYKPSEKADVFGLACIFVDILSYMHKFRTSDITKHIRSSRKVGKSQKLFGSGFDTSFHGNLPRVHTWLDFLADRAFEMDDWCFRAVPHLISMIRAMLCPDPCTRPTALAVREHIKGILTQYGKLREEELHCGHALDGWDNRTSYSTYPSSTAPSVKSSLGLRNSMYTSSSRYASTHYSSASAPTGDATRGATRNTRSETSSQRDSTQPKFANLLSSGTFP